MVLPSNRSQGNTWNRRKSLRKIHEGEELNRMSEGQGSPQETGMKQSNILGKLLLLIPIDDVELHNITIRVLFSLSFDAKAESRMVAEGLVAQIKPIIESE
ncbi:hypothetical protein KIN20_023299 [Parelaphostrongylus tenuis]|uniref:Uncharacterized protein n=1 Tax=Parelaphostrongylus tenuis TaxID=148309 RepID=A0AAD5QXA9_PARTN|nr:hypothetical protein KIN20_023299 [Parelaphostrongylus tenuis]